ncbi:protein transport protein SEC24 [Sarotherodon galilaeus]
MDAIGSGLTYRNENTEDRTHETHAMIYAPPLVGGSSTGHAHTVPLIFLQLKNGVRNAAGHSSVVKVNSKAALKSTGT